ncbi:MAG TPA: DUF559 domain-containing protein [Bacteroidales bacterium]|nr:DUF559 domain-containing protein [Bacteroidales bacterium]
MRRLINESKHHHGSSLAIKSKARDLRKAMTYSEMKLWKRLRGRKLKGRFFRRQHPYGMYILDFYCFQADLVIEVDGGIHRFKENYDAERTEFLEATGLKVIRFKNDDVINRIDWVIEEIEKNL